MVFLRARYERFGSGCCRQSARCRWHRAVERNRHRDAVCARRACCRRGPDRSLSPRSASRSKPDRRQGLTLPHRSTPRAASQGDRQWTAAGAAGLVGVLRLETWPEHSFAALAAAHPGRPVTLGGRPVLPGGHPPQPAQGQTRAQAGDMGRLRGVLRCRPDHSPRHDQPRSARPADARRGRSGARQGGTRICAAPRAVSHGAAAR
jgi:hypothetical protein